MGSLKGVNISVRPTCSDSKNPLKTCCLRQLSVSTVTAQTQQQIKSEIHGQNSEWPIKREKEISHYPTSNYQK